ncbi:hypothetical protein GJ698_09300 [Pseudoduganella sp. FT26W]|uniref:Uncharacterized protein n=1 Tax=Duganella aquatilis TaxID=2666082 RepID=A0A844CZZ3_9BURK|nr:hypothetical protein [Duganella aquatilis]MRW84281.1 hypothetical protein [Duganella aquatilis]
MNANSDREYIDNKVGDVRTAVDDLRVAMNERFVAVHARFDSIDARIESAVAKGTAEIIKWVVGLFVTTIALNVALASVVLHVALREPPPSTPAPAVAPGISTPSLIIQLSPQGAAVLPAAPAGRP